MALQDNLTPAMRQYWEIKKRLPDCILLFRMGDFYETFYDDAKRVSHVLQIVLTSRGKGDKRAPLAGIPFHALDAYLHKLIKAGYKVAIVEQLEDPKKAKGLVKRGVVRIITPGTVTEDTLLEMKSNNYIMTFYGKDNFGIAVSDFSTGEFYVTKINKDEVWDEIERFSPKEILLPEEMRGSRYETEISKKGIMVNFISDSYYWFDNAQNVLLEHFKVYSLDAIGVGDKDILSASGALIKYFYDTQFKNISHITKLSWYDPRQRMIIDGKTLRNLEIVKNQVDNSVKNTLFSVIDKTVTPMGSRKLKSWLLSPLINMDKIIKRLDAVEYFVKDYQLGDRVRDILGNVYDIHRITTRVAMGNVTPKELLSLKKSLAAIPLVKKMLLGPENQPYEIEDICRMNDLNDIKQLIEHAITDDPPTLIRDGGMIREGFSEELDEMRKMVNDSRKWLADLEMQEKNRTGIKSLKIGYNKVMGYYIEIPKSQTSKVPIEYIRKSTQKNTERFITPELKEKEAIILNANEQILSKEIEIYTQIIDKIKERIGQLQTIADSIARLDVYASLAVVARENGYVRPEIVSDDIVLIKKGRHPVVETMVDSFIPNDVRLDTDQRVMIITGPNMSGKSTSLRQTALIILMAQAGSFVPAEKARIGIVDRIFSRVGARDDIAHGQSTFMMEMTETANILNNATDRSFVILDEIGRGTSTYDGMALAWAIIEYIERQIKCKTMFATHYHLLNLLSLKYKDIVNYNIGVKEQNGEIIFIHKLLPGGTDKSYGVHVAKLAGLPKEVIIRAMQIASTLEKSDHVHKEALSNLTLNILNEDNLEKLEDKFNITIENEKELEKREKNMKQTNLFMFEE